MLFSYLIATYEYLVSHDTCASVCLREECTHSKLYSIIPIWQDQQEQQSMTMTMTTCGGSCTVNSNAKKKIETFNAFVFWPVYRVVRSTCA